MFQVWVRLKRSAYTLYLQMYQDQCTIFTPLCVSVDGILGTKAEFLNQVRTGHRPAHTWFHKIVSVWTSVCVCVSTPEAINN